MSRGSGTSRYVYPANNNLSIHFNNRRVGANTANDGNNSGDHDYDEGEGDGVEEGGNEGQETAGDKA